MEIHTRDTVQVCDIYYLTYVLSSVKLAPDEEGPMTKRHPKRQFLEEAGALHRAPDRVRAELFERHRFFDPLDKIQVKYEMLRAHAVEGRSVGETIVVRGGSLGLTPRRDGRNATCRRVAERSR